MTIRNTSRDANGQAGSPQQDHSEDQGRRLARVTARQLRRAPGVPASGARFLVAHAFWILAVTIAVVGAAAALVFSQKPLYKAQAVVAVQQAAVAASSGNPPNMATEEDVATSGAVLAMASRLLNVPVATLASGVSVHVPSTTTLLQIAYTDPVPRIAQQRAQAIAQAYIHYRSPQPAAPAKNPAKSAPLSTTPTAVLVTPALLPTSPASPDYMIDMGAALIVGLALGLGTAWLRDRMDDRLRGPHDLEAQAGAPVLALIPAFRTGRNCGGRLPVVTNPDSVVAEAYRGLRMRVVQTATSRNAWTLLVTSPGWEDKGTVAANLAVALAQSGRGVVLICADQRWGQAHKLLGPGNRDGADGLLDERTSLVGALQATEAPGLQLLPPGVIPTDPAALVQRPNWHTALNVLQRHADVVVIEAPPMLTGPDAGLLADLAGMVLVVADARRTRRVQLRAAMREVEHVRDKLVGCVLDNVGRPRRLPARRPVLTRVHAPMPTRPSGGTPPANEGRAVIDGIWADTHEVASSDADTHEVASSDAALATSPGSADPNTADSGPADSSANQGGGVSPGRNANASLDGTAQSITSANGNHPAEGEPALQQEVGPASPGRQEFSTSLAAAASLADVQHPGPPPSPIEDQTIPEASPLVPGENSWNSTSGLSQEAAPDIPQGEGSPADIPQGEGSPADIPQGEGFPADIPQGEGSPADIPQGEGSPATAQPSPPGEPELRPSDNPRPSVGSRDGFFPTMPVIMIVAALIGSALVMLLRSGLLT